MRTKQIGLVFIVILLLMLVVWYIFPHSSMSAVLTRTNFGVITLRVDSFGDGTLYFETKNNKSIKLIDIKFIDYDEGIMDYSVHDNSFRLVICNYKNSGQNKVFTADLEAISNDKIK